MLTIEKFRQRLALTEDQFGRAANMIQRLVKGGILYLFDTPLDAPLQSLFESDWGYLARTQGYQMMMAARMDTDYRLTLGIASLLSSIDNAQDEPTPEKTDDLLIQVLEETEPVLQKTYSHLYSQRYDSPIFAAEFNQLLVLHAEVILRSWVITDELIPEDEAESIVRSDPAKGTSHLVDELEETWDHPVDSSVPAFGYPWKEIIELSQEHRAAINESKIGVEKSPVCSTEPMEKSPGSNLKNGLSVTAPPKRNPFQKIINESCSFIPTGPVQDATSAARAEQEDEWNALFGDYSAAKEKDSTAQAPKLAMTPAKRTKKPAKRGKTSTNQTKDTQTKK